MRVHRTPFRPLWTELKGFGSRRTVAARADGVQDRPVAPRRFTPKDVLRETLITHLAVAPDGSSAVYGRRTIEGNEYRIRLWRVPLTRGRAEQITTGDVDVRPASRPTDGRCSSSRPAPGSRSPGCCPSRAASRASSRSSTARSEPPSGRRTAGASSPSPRAASSGSASATRSPRPPGTSPGLNWRLDGAGIREQFTSLWVVPASGGRPRRLTEPDVRGRVTLSGRPTRSGSASWRIRGPRRPMLEELQAWSVPTRGGRPAKLAALEGEIAAASWSPERKARTARNRRARAGRVGQHRALGEGRPRSATTRRGARSHLLQRRHDRPRRLRVALPAAGDLARRRERRRAGDQRRNVRPIPVRPRRLGRAPRRPRRRSLLLARGGRRPDS